MALYECQLEPEEKLLLQISAPCASSVNRLDLPSSLSWEKVIRLARSHNLLPQLAITLSRQGLSRSLPEAIAKNITSLALAARLADSAHARALAELKKTLDEADIPFMLLKGQSLAERLYHEPCERLSGDIDILVARTQLARTDEILQALGYRSSRPAYYKKRHFHFVYVHPSHKVPGTIEVHWELTRSGYPIQFEPSRWWEQACTTRIRAGEVLIPAPVQELTYLAWHGLHRPPTLRDLSDVARLWDRMSAELSWSFIRTYAKQVGAFFFLVTALRLCYDFWGIDHEVETRFDLGGARGRVSESLLDSGKVLRKAGRLGWPARGICQWSLTPPDRVSWLQLIRWSLPSYPWLAWLYK